MNRKENGVQWWYELLGMMIAVLLIVIVLFTFVVRLTIVDGSSMYPTLKDQEIMVTWRLGVTPKQGDVVVLTKESYSETSIVKRVVATEGQHVTIDYDANRVYVDGAALEEGYINWEEADPLDARPGWIDDVTVPEGCIFVMGDNRNHSSDSRDPDIGLIPVDCVIGRSVLVVFPFRFL